MDHEKHIIKLFLIVLFMLAPITFSQNPRLFFSRSDLAQIKNRIALDENNLMVWNDIIARADEYCHESSRYFFETSDVKESVLKFIKPHHWPILAGRVLSVQCEALGPAYWITGKEKYGLRGKEIFLAYVRQLPADSPQTEKFIALARGELMRGLAQGYDWFSPLLSGRERDEAARACKAYVDNEIRDALVPAWYVPYSNWTGVSIGGAGMLALAISDELPDNSSVCINECENLIRSFFKKSFGPEGEYSEHGYIEYAMTNISLFADALMRSEGVELFEEANFRNVSKWLVYEMIPGSTVIESRNDTGYPDSKAGYRFAQPWGLRMAKVNLDGFARYIWDTSPKKKEYSDYPCQQVNHSSTVGYSIFRILWANDVAPTTPSPDKLQLCKFFPRRGLTIWRTGWQTDDIFFSIESGQPFPVTHDQADAGSFNLYAFGHQWAVDAGYGNLKRANDRSQGTSHNIVQIDGESQALVGGGLVVGGVSKNYEDTDLYSYVLCDATEGYNYTVQRKPDSFQTEKVQSDLASGAEKVLRHSIYMKPSEGAMPYFVLLDDVVQDNNQHTFKWQMLADTRSAISFEDKTATLSYQNNSLLVTMNSISDGKWELGQKQFSDGRLPSEFKTIGYEAVSKNPYFAAVLMPLKADDKKPKLNFCNESDAVTIIVEWENRLDTLIWEYNLPKPKILVKPRKNALAQISGNCRNESCVRLNEESK